VRDMEAYRVSCPPIPTYDFVRWRAAAKAAKVATKAEKEAAKAPAVAPKTAKPPIKPKDLPEKIHDDSQGKHIINHNSYDPKKGRSTLAPNVEAQELLNGVRNGKYLPDGHELRNGHLTVDFGKVIGTYKKGEVSVPTTRGTIHAGEKGAHIVPAPPIKPK